VCTSRANHRGPLRPGNAGWDGTHSAESAKGSAAFRRRRLVRSSQPNLRSSRFQTVANVHKLSQAAKQEADFRNGPSGQGSGSMKSSMVRIGNLWCRVMHAQPMWPSHGQYECRTCGRHHLVCWEGPLPLTPRMQAFSSVAPQGSSVIATESGFPCS
jgi:hypothetical protein